MVYLKAIQKSTPIGVSVSGNIDQKTYLKKFRGGFSPLSPPGSAYDTGMLKQVKSLYCAGDELRNAFAQCSTTVKAHTVSCGLRVNVGLQADTHSLA